MSTSAPELRQPPPPPISVREKGYEYGGSITLFYDDLANEPTPELVWPNSILVFDRMRRQDAQVSSVLRAISAPIVRTTWSIDGTGCRDEVTQYIASNLGLPITGAEAEGEHKERIRGRDRFSWNKHLKSALLMLPFGHMFFEQLYRPDPDFPDRYRLRKLGQRLPASIENIHVARDGGLVAIEQKPPLDGTFTFSGLSSTTIPVNRLVAYVNEREGGNWFGHSVLRPAYKNWLLKDRALRAWMTALERNGMGVPIYVAAENETSLEAGKEVVTNLRGGPTAGAAVAHGAEVLIKGVDGQTVDAEKFIRYQDEQIARAVLAHFLNLGTQTGSWALGTTLSEFFTLALGSVADDLVDVANGHIIEDLVDINFGRSEPAPQLVYSEIGSTGGVDDEVTFLRKAAGLEKDEDLAQFLRQHVTGAAA